MAKEDCFGQWKKQTWLSGLSIILLLWIILNNDSIISIMKARLSGFQTIFLVFVCGKEMVNYCGKLPQSC